MYCHHPQGDWNCPGRCRSGEVQVTLLTPATGWGPKKWQVSESWTATDSEQVLPVVPLPIIPTDSLYSTASPGPICWTNAVTISKTKVRCVPAERWNTQKTKQTKYCHLTSTVVLLIGLTLAKCKATKVFRSTATSVGGTKTLFYHMNESGALKMYLGP
jgi:hypothetical protein